MICLIIKIKNNDRETVRRETCNIKYSEKN